MGFFKKIFKKKKQEPEIFKIEMFGKEFNVDVSKTALTKYADKHSKLKDTAWEGANEIERIRDDGVILYKSNWVTSYERDEIGFHGLKRYSENNKYCVVFVDNTKDLKENIALVDVPTKQILFKIKLQRPHRCYVSNEGFTICEDWEGYESAACSLYLLDNSGKILKQNRHTTGIGDLFMFTENQKTFTYNINSTGEIHKIETF